VCEGANVSSRDVNCRAWLMDNSNSCSRPTVLSMQGVCVIGSQLKCTKLPELYRIVPADSLPRPPPAVM